MKKTFNAILATESAGKRPAELVELSLADLPDEPVLVAVQYSTLNYKDGLALSGRSPICRTLPLICGIDLAGVVESSHDARWKPGDEIVINGYGLSETFNGGYSQYQRVKAEWPIALPEGLSLKQSMAIGTAGYTAMLCVQALEDHGLTPDDGPVLVTGAAGGVGSVAVSLLNRLGYEVHASTGRVASQGPFLTALGASDLIPRESLDRKSKPLEKERWAGAIDTVGSSTLVSILSQMRREGIVAACGLAGGMDLPGTVAPFILRGVTLRGIDSVMASHPRRVAAWDRLATTIDHDHLETLSSTVALSELPDLANKIVDGEIRGRIIVDVNR